MLLALALTALSAFIDEDAPEPPAPTSRWGAVAGTSVRLGVRNAVNSAIGPRFALLPPPQRLDALYFTPAIALLAEGEAGLDKGNGALGLQLRVELMLAPGGGLLVPWAVAWVSGGAGAAWLGTGAATPVLHVGAGLGGNAFADAGAWGPTYGWADLLEGISWPLILFATFVSLPVALAHVELRYTFYPEQSGARASPPAQQPGLAWQEIRGPLRLRAARFAQGELSSRGQPRVEPRRAYHQPL
ncbi:MAG: hypothetical protein IPJ65_16540 [Archangiaceae bacterium]|nr:hypothetical protein [Archangiaceae bacterium]